VPCVEGDVALLGGFKERRDAGGVAAIEHRSQQGGANTFALLVWVGPQDRQVEMRLDGMMAFDLAHGTSGSREARHQRRQHRQQHERLARVLAPAPGLRPQHRPGSLRGRVDQLLRSELA